MNLPLKTSGLVPVLLCAAISALGEPQTLKEAYRDDFLLGAALNPAQFTEANAVEASLVKAQFNAISPENVLKWESVHPRPGDFDFSLADQYVEFGMKNKMFILGHNLIWHSQTPGWVFENADGTVVNRDLLLARMKEHIQKVVGRYRGKIGGWDVVNEALNEDGTLRNSRWRRIIGEDYLAKAYTLAHEADPRAQLYYNDYGLENLAKRKGAVALIEALRAQGATIDAVGIQGHYRLDTPSAAEVDATISTFAKMGLKVMITELDVDVLPANWRGLTADVSFSAARQAGMNPYTNGLPKQVEQRLAARYAELFSVFRKHRGEITRVTFWGVTDGNSWLNNWPVPRRTNYPLLFDRQGQPKPAFDAVMATARN